MDFRVLLDMDGCIYDWLESGFSVLGIDPYDPMYADIIRHEHDAVDLICGKETVNKTIDALGYEFWANLKMLPWAKELYAALSELGEVTILTSPGKWLDAGKGKAIALRRDFGAGEFMLAKKKEVAAMPNAILIDDKPSNIAKFRKRGGWAWLWPNQYLIFDGNPTQKQAVSDCLSYIRRVKKYMESKETVEVNCIDLFSRKTK